MCNAVRLPVQVSHIRTYIYPTHEWLSLLRNCSQKCQNDKPGRLTAAPLVGLFSLVVGFLLVGHVRQRSISAPRKPRPRRTEIQARNFKWLLLAVNLNFTLAHISCVWQSVGNTRWVLNAAANYQLPTSNCYALKYPWTVGTATTWMAANHNVNWRINSTFPLLSSVGMCACW